MQINADQCTALQINTGYADQTASDPLITTNQKVNFLFRFEVRELRGWTSIKQC